MNAKNVLSVELAYVLAKKMRQNFWLILIGFLLQILSSFLWNAGLLWCEWLYIPGLACVLTGLTAMYQQRKGLLNLIRRVTNDE